MTKQIVEAEGIIFDWIGTLYERNKGLFTFSELVLQKLKPKYKFGLISLAKSGIEDRRKELVSSGTLHYFDSVIVDTAKTHQQYEECMRQMNTTPATTIVVDDRTIRGIKLGNQLGCTTFWIQKGEYADETPNQDTGQPTYTIYSIEDILQFLL